MTTLGGGEHSRQLCFPILVGEACAYVQGASLKARALSTESCHLPDSGRRAAMPCDALGHPERIDTLVTAGGTIRILRYGLSGQGRFSGRVRLEDGVVVGWMRE